MENYIRHIVFKSRNCNINIRKNKTQDKMY